MENIEYIIPFAFAGIWVIVTYFISRMGWADLAAKYQIEKQFIGQRIGLISAMINGSSYQNTIILKYNDEGLYLKSIIFFRLFHPPVLIPWKEIKEVRDQKIFLTKYKELIIGNPFVATMKIRTQTFNKFDETFERNKAPLD